MLKKYMISMFVTAAILTQMGCASLTSVSLTSIPAQRSNVVKTEKDKMVFLGFNFDNDFVNSAVADLKSQCPNGKVTGILTKDERIHYFLIFVWKMRLTAEGYCVSAPQTAKAGL